MSSPNINNLINNYWDQCDAQFKQELSLLKEIESIEKKIDPLAQQTSNIQKQISAYEHAISELKKRPESDTVRGQIGQDESVIHNLKKKLAPLKAKEAPLEAAESAAFQQLDQYDSNFSNFEVALKSLRSGMGSVQTKADLTKLQNYLTQLFTAMEDELQEAKASHKCDQDKANGNINAMIQDAAAMISAGSAERAILDPLNSAIQADYQIAQNQFNKANEEYNSYNWWEETFSVSAKHHMEEYARQRAEASNMMNVLSSFMQALAPCMASIQPEFMQLSLFINEIVHKILAIMEDPNLSSAAKQAKILPLMMFLLGLFSLVDQTAENLKASNQQKMAQANEGASQNNLNETSADIVLEREEIKNARVLQLTMFIAKVVIGAILTVCGGGPFTSLLMGVMTGLSISGGPYHESVLDKWTDQLAKDIGGKHARVWAEVIMAVIEFVVLVGVGGGLDYIPQAAAQTAVNTAVNTAVLAVEDLIRSIVDEIVDKTEDVAQNEAEQIATNVLTSAARQAALAAGKTVMKSFMQQSILQISKSMSTLLQTIEKAATEAANEAVQRASLIAQEAVERSVTDEGVQALDQETLKIIDQKIALVVDDAAAKGVAKATDCTVSAAQKAVDNLNTLPWGKALFYLAYTLASNQVIVDLPLMMAKKDNSDGDDKLKEALQIVQALIMVLMTYMGSTGGSPVFSQEIGTMLRTLSWLQISAQGAAAGSTLGLGLVKEDQAETTAAMQMTSALSDILQASLRRVNQNASTEIDNFLQRQNQEQQSQRILGRDLYKGTAWGIQVLVDQAV